MLLYTLAGLLVLLWIAGIAASLTAGGAIYLLLLASVVAVVFQNLRYRGIAWRDLKPRHWVHAGARP